MNRLKIFSQDFIEAWGGGSFGLVYHGRLLLPDREREVEVNQLDHNGRRARGSPGEVLMPSLLKLLRRRQRRR